MIVGCCWLGKFCLSWYTTSPNSRPASSRVAHCSQWQPVACLYHFTRLPLCNMEDAKVLVKDKFFTASETVELLLPYLGAFSILSLTNVFPATVKGTWRCFCVDWSDRTDLHNLSGELEVREDFCRIRGPREKDSVSTQKCFQFSWIVSVLSFNAPHSVENLGRCLDMWGHFKQKHACQFM